MRTVGVEEELLLVDAHHDRTSPVATRVIRMATDRGEVEDSTVGGSSLVNELQEQQLETCTSPHVSLAALEVDLRARRRTAATAARRADARVVAAGTSPVAFDPRRVHAPRYDRMAERFGIITSDHLTCGCHVHVAVTSPDEAVGVLDRIRVWLPCLLALSANSPYWQGQDTSYASYRSQALGRWPVSGPTEVFGSAARYRELVDSLLASEVILDEAMVYFDARCSARYPTVEIRVPDVCLDVRDTVLMAALGRALVEIAADQWARGQPAARTPATLLRLATWQAARWGVGDRLLDPRTSLPRPAVDVIRALVDHVRPALRGSADEAVVTDGIERVLTRGNGSTRQREVFARTGHLTDVIAALARVTVGQDD